MTTIVLLSCSISWSKSKQDTIPSTGELVANDSILVSYDDIRKANAKMIELQYEKEINDSLCSIINNDERIIQGYNEAVKKLNKEVIKYKQQRNTSIVIGSVITIILTNLLIIK